MNTHRPIGRRPMAGVFLILVSLLLLASSGIVYTAPSANAAEPAKIEGKGHEGQSQGTAGNTATLGGYTSGNVTSYQEGDRLNFHLVLTANYDGLSGSMQIRYSREVDGVCNFFEPTLTLGSHTTGLPAVESVSGEVPTLTLGSLTSDGTEWVQQIDIQFSSGTTGGDDGGEAVVNYHLTLDQNVTGCTGSSQHSRLSAPDSSGDYQQTGLQNVPVPASAVVRLPDITVTKYIDRDGNGSFESTAAAGEYSFTLDGTTTLLTDSNGQVLFENVQPDGDHTVTETQADFAQGTYGFISGAGTNCTFTGSTATAGIAAGTLTQVENASCEFYNRAVPGSITIIKDAVGANAAAAEFDFTTTGLTPGTFSLGDGGSRSFIDLAAGQYVVTEAAESGWDLTGLVCSGDTGSTIGINGNVVTIGLAASEQITCTFTNTERGRIYVDKVTDPSGSAQQFEFDPSWGVNFLLADGDTPYDSGLMAPGAYSVAEVTPLPAGWSPTSATCSDGSDPAAIDLGAGEVVTCVFSNMLARGRILVDKVADPSGDQTQFEFDPSWDGNFFLTDAAAAYDSGALLPGTYSVAEVNLPVGWTLTGVTCSDGSDPSRIDLSAGEVVTCTFNNRLGRGDIVVDKITDPSGSAQQFEFAPSWGSNFLLADGDAPHNSGALLPGIYSVAEVNLPAGWSLIGATCSDGSSPAAIGLDSGEVVTCTFSDYLARGRIVVDKVTEPSGSAQQFEFDPSWGANFPLTDTGTPVDSGELLPGIYSVAEVNLPAGWSSTGAVCSDGSLPAAIDLAAGETVTCTFTNTQSGRIYVDKVTDPSGSAQQFEFDPSWGINFLLADGDAPHDSGLLAPGGYSVAEVTPLPAGWLPTSATCSDGSDPAAIDLAPGETVTCVFSNMLERGRIYVDKVTDPSGSAQQFEFDPSWDGNFFLTDAAAAHDSGALLPGTYSVAEVNLPVGWSLTGITCSDGSDPSRIDLGPGEVVTCTFDNTQSGRILVDKVTDPSGDQTLFEFDPSWGDNFLLADGDSPFDSGYLFPGAYSVAEVNLPAGWSLIGATCSDGSDPAAIDLGAGEVVTCTFSNLNPPEGSITVIKDATPLDASGDDTPFGFSGDLGAFILRDPSDPAKTISDLAPGQYVVAEDALPENWVFESVLCDARSWSADGSSVTIDLAQGETVVCTFSNFQQETLAPTGVLTIIKDASPGDNTVFSFDAGALGTFSLMDPADPSKTFSQLEPGTYTVTEAAPTGAWAFRTVECTAGDWSADGRTVTVNLAEGEVAECTFFNDGELPFTGPDGTLVPALLAGLAALTLGFGLLLLSRRRETA